MLTLMVLSFVHRTTADAAAEDVLEFDPDLLLGPDAIAVVRCDDDGTVQVTTNHRPGRVARQTFWHVLFSSLILPSASTLPAARQHSKQLTELGMAASFQDQLRTLMTPDTSALFLLVNDAGSADRGLALLARFGGSLLATSLVPDVESRIQPLGLPEGPRPGGVGGMAGSTIAGHGG